MPSLIPATGTDFVEVEDTLINDEISIHWICRAVSERLHTDDDTIEVGSLKWQLMIALYIILLHLCLDHLRDLWYTLAWSLGGGGTTWSRVLVLINKSGAYKASLEKKTLAGQRDLILRWQRSQWRAGQVFPLMNSNWISPINRFSHLRSIYKWFPYVILMQVWIVS